jgi:hypothetical protein
MIAFVPFIVEFCSRVLICLFSTFYNCVPRLHLICSFVLALFLFYSHVMFHYALVFLFSIIYSFVLHLDLICSFAIAFVPFIVKFCSRVLICLFSKFYNCGPRLQPICSFAVALFLLQSCHVPLCSCVFVPHNL